MEDRKRGSNRKGLKLLSRGEELLHHPLHSRLSFISHSNRGAKSVTLINRPARNTNQYCRGIINPLCSQSSLQKVKLKLIEITFCWLIVALSRVKEGRLMACVPLSGISEIDVSWRTRLLRNMPPKGCLYFETVLEYCAIYSAI